MKRLTLCLLTLLPYIVWGQYQSNFLHESFFGRLPSARAEAMGRAYTSIDGDLTSVFFNPAGIASIKGIELDGSYASPYYVLNNASYSFFSMGYKFNDLLTVALSKNSFHFGQEIQYTDAMGNSFGTFIPQNHNYTITLASQPVKNLLIGLNANYFKWTPPMTEAAALYLDLGAIKKIAFKRNKEVEHVVNIGASITNLNFAKTRMVLSGKTSEEHLPVITRYGANYQLTMSKNLLIDTLNTFTFLLQGEYKKLLNSPYLSGIHLGVEITFIEFLSARLGYYEEKQDDYNNPTVNRNQISAITYGFGLQLPVHKLTKLPLQVHMDYTILPQPSHTLDKQYLSNFSTYNLRLCWLINGKNLPWVSEDE